MAGDFNQVVADEFVAGMVEANEGFFKTLVGLEVRPYLRPSLPLAALLLLLGRPCLPRFFQDKHIATIVGNPDEFRCCECLLSCKYLPKGPVHAKPMVYLNCLKGKQQLLDLQGLRWWLICLVQWAVNFTKCLGHLSSWSSHDFFRHYFDLDGPLYSKHLLQLPESQKCQTKANPCGRDLGDEAIY